MPASKIFLYFCLSFILGIFISSMLGSLPGSEVYLLLPGLILGIFLISLFWRRKKFVVIGFCILFLVLGISRHQMAEIRSTKHEIPASPAGGRNTNEIITLTGIIAEEPDIREKSQKLTIKIEEIQSPKPVYGTNERVLATTNRYPEYKYGDKLKIIGKLESPAEDINGFNYKDYLKKDGIYATMNWPKTELMGSGFGNPVMGILLSFKYKFKETARRFVSPPEVGILEALIFGDEGQISNEWREKLNITGTRHIVAVSGMNITIIASLILSFFLALGFWRRQAFYFSIILLTLYILMLGAPASALRAGIMGGILLLGQNSGRLSQSWRLLFFAAAFMLILNPLLLRLDVGFQLSFVATLGIIFLQPIFSNWFRKIIKTEFKIFPIKTTVSTTLSAQVFTLPILVYNFGYISSVSLITNILIVPILAPLTVLIFLFGLAGMFFYFLGWIFYLPVWLGLAYLVKIIDIFSSIPFAFLGVENIHWFWPLISYLILILGLVVWRLKKCYSEP